MNDNRWFIAWVVVGCALALFVAYVNRAGTEPASSDPNPLPWLGLGLTFVVGGLLAYRLRRS